jgi:hypothetical protein
MRYAQGICARSSDAGNKGVRRRCRPASAVGAEHRVLRVDGLREDTC